MIVSDEHNTVGDRAEDVASALAATIAESQVAGEDVASPQWRRRLIDAACARMAMVRGVSAMDWEPGDASDPLSPTLETWPKRIWDDPHALGWIHEQYAAAARHDSFADHVHREQKHSSATITTQLYTPRWIADALVLEALNATVGEDVTILDPAVGGGQMLVAALAALADKAPSAPAEEWVQSLWGFDLDPQAVGVARRTIALEVARRKGRRVPEAEAVCREQIVVADGLQVGEPQRWSVVITNPPYMGWRSMPMELREALDPRFRPYHSDLFSAFIARCHELSDQVVAILAQQTIWYLRRFEKARRNLLERGRLRFFLHLGAGAFWNLDGEKASVVAFVQDSREDQQAKAQERQKKLTRVWDLRGATGPAAKRQAFQRGVDDCVTKFDVATTEAIPGRPICHDLSVPLRQLFEMLPPLVKFADIPGGQHKTGRNREYVRRWNEVEPAQLHCVEALGGRGMRPGRWVFYSKGGRFAPWWGNWQWVVDWSDKARCFYDENKNSNLLHERYWFRQGIVYTDFGGRRFNARWMPPGCLFDMTGPAIFPAESWWPRLTERQRIGAAMAVLNSSPARRMLRALNPTLHFQVRDVRALPVPEIDAEWAIRIAEDVWKLVEGIQRLHGDVDEDPLFHDRRKGFEEKITLQKLAEIEAEIDSQICEAYGVSRQPIEKATVFAHHAIGQ